MYVKYFNHEFLFSKFSALDGKTKCTWVEAHPAEPEKAFTVEADQTGVFFKGNSPVIQTRGQLEDFARFVADAWSQHMKLAPKIHQSLSGH